MTQGYIPNELIEEILDRTDIVALIESYIPLKRRGRNYVGLCPFHLEDTPSFSVSPEKQMFYCFGCQKGGSALTFVMEYEHLSFFEAAEKLAARAGVTLPEKQLSPGQQRVRDEKRRLTEINELAAKYYREQLKHSAVALQYLEKRGISPEIAERFSLGYARDSWEELKDFLKQKGYKEPELVSSGVITKAESGKCYDRFRNRLMFPICDKKGAFIAFGGRVLDDGQPKYLNTPETPVFHKGRNLYALHLAYTAIRREEEVFLMEGNVDVITAHQFGIDNAVAPLGTAFTEDHAKILKRYCSRVIVAFDGDGAGQRATNKALDILHGIGIRAYAMTIPAPHDPDEYIRAYGKEGWMALREKALTYMDFKIRLAMNSFDPETPEGKADILTALGPSLMTIGNMVERSEYIHEISEQLHISEELLRNDIRRKTAEGRNDFGRGAVLEDAKAARGITMAKDCVLTFAAEHREIFEEIEATTHWNFLDTAAQRGVVRILRDHGEEYSWRLRDLVNYAAEEDKNMIFAYIMEDPFAMAEDRSEMFRDCWRSIRKEALVKEKAAIQQRIKESEKSGQNGEIEVLLRNFAKIQQELRNI